MSLYVLTAPLWTPSCLIPLARPHFNQSIVKLTSAIRNNEHLNDLITLLASVLNSHIRHTDGAEHLKIIIDFFLFFFFARLRRERGHGDTVTRHVHVSEAEVDALCCDSRRELRTRCAEVVM